MTESYNPDDPFIEFDDSLMGVWYLQLTECTDVLAAVVALPSGKFSVRYRVRHYRDNMVFDSEDKKSYYVAEVSDPLETVLQKMRKILHTMRLFDSLSLFEIVRGSLTTEEMAAAFESWPVVHRKAVP